MKKSAVRLFPAFLLCLLLTLMLFNSAYVLEGAKSGLLLWYDSVVPALFPFMVLSGMIVASGGVSILTAPFHFFLRPLLGLSKPGCYVLIAGLLCGYPMGAKICADFLREGRITESEGQYLMAVCNHPSPMFLLGFAYPLIRDASALPLFLLSIYGPVVFIAAAAKLPVRLLGDSRMGNQKRRPCPTSGTAGFPSQKTLSKAAVETPAGIDAIIMNAFEVLIKIGGYLILFSIMIAFLFHAKSVPPFPRLLLIGAMEMTTGVKQLSALLPPPYAGAAVCACLSFGGISGIFQTKAVIDTKRARPGEDLSPREASRIDHLYSKKAGLSIRHYVLWKLVHSLGSFLIYLLLSPLFPGPHLPPP